jgi:predicted LPLAT superfamily acyltransferase
MPEKHTWDGRSKGSPLGFRIFVYLLKVGGASAAYGLLRFVTVYYRLFAPAAIKPLQYLYRQRMGFSAARTRQLISRNLIWFGQILIDKIIILSGLPSKLTFSHEGVEHIEQLVADGKGGLLVSAHLGNWEVAGHLLKRVNTTINILMYDGEADQIKNYMEQFDSKRSFNIILVKEDLTHIYEMSAALNRNELICIHADRFRPGNRTFRHLLLGEETSFPAGPFILASKLKAPVCFVFAFKKTNEHYNFYAFPGRVYEGRGQEGALRMLDDYTELLEEKVKEYPEQWFNYYNFWSNE